MIREITNRQMLSKMLPFYHESLRPQFHFTAKRGWLNDPNGLVYADGEYHLFFQHDPDPAGQAGRNMHWGHAVSRDLLHWQELSIALYPDEEFGQKYSGTAIVDKNNDSGLKYGDSAPIILFYTAVGSRGFTQCAAYSNDSGRTWQQDPANPLISEIVDGNRDPKVFYCHKSGKWVMLLWVKPGFRFFTSENLRDWQAVSQIDGFYECPDIFELPIIDEPDKCRWILVNGNGDYLIGDFDGTDFCPETSVLPGDCGMNFYATQTWQHAPGNRVIQIAWMRGGKYPGMPFNQQMSFPCELSLRKSASGLRLCRYPIGEIAGLYESSQVLEGKELSIGERLCQELPSGSIDAEIAFKLLPDAEFTFSINDEKLRYQAGEQTLLFRDKSHKLTLQDGRLELRILLDLTSLEIFANHGELSISNCLLPEENGNHLIIEPLSGICEIRRMQIHKIKSVWK